MKISTHDNGWTAMVDDIKLQEANDMDAQVIGHLIADKTVVVFRNQNLTASEETAFCAKIGQVESYSQRMAEAAQAELDTAGKTLYNKMEGILEPETAHGSVIRVTGEHDDHGRPGLFGHATELDWHCNNAANEWRDPIVWLYGVKGTAGSKTSWINTILAYEDLSDELKQQYADIKSINGYSADEGYSAEVFAGPEDINTGWTPNIVHTNIAGHTGLYFPFLQMHQIAGMNEADSKEFIIKVRDHLLQEKYMYHHDWQDGDVVISEQWLGLHKRWHCDTMDQRVLHRICFNFDHIKF